MKLNVLAGTALVFAVGAGLGGCAKKEEAMGPAQKAGAAIDNAGDKVAAKLHEGLDKANEAANAVAENAKATREEIEKATDDASKGVDRATEEVGKKVERAGEKIQEAAK